MIEQLELMLDIDKSNMIYQHNSLVMASYDMTSLEQKLFLMLLSTIKKNDDELIRSTFKVRDIAEVFQVTPQSLYRDLPKICKRLIERVVEIKQPNGNWEMFSIISYAQYMSKEGKLVLEVHSKAKPYLLRLQEMFTNYRLENIVGLKSKYAIRLYQQSKGCLYKGGDIISLIDFRKMLKLDKKTYDRFDCITSKVLKPSIDEINSKTDINVAYETILDCRKVVAIKLIVSAKKVGIAKQSKTKIDPKSFNNFEGRNYDYDLLERKLLGWD